METIFKKEIIEKVSDEISCLKITSEELPLILKAGIIALYPEMRSVLENETINYLDWSLNDTDHYKIYLKE